MDDADAWNRLCAIYAPLVTGWVRRSGLREWDVDDVVQEVFRQLATKLNLFRRERTGDSFRGWLWTVTRNEVRGWYRKQNRLQEKALGGSTAHAMMMEVPDWIADDSIVDQIPVNDSDEAMLIQRAADAVRQDFAAHTWQAFWRSTVDGQSAREIADDLGMTPVAVRQAKFRVLTRLREFLA